MNTITVDTNTLRALMLFTAGSKDPRFYLRGIHLETGPDGARFTTTNGHVLGAHFTPGAFAVSDGIIPGDLVSNALKIAGKVAALDIEIEAGPYRPFYTLAGLRAEAVDDRYPDITRVLPKGKPSGQCAQFNPEYVALFGKAAKLLGKSSYIHIAHDGPHMAAMVTVGREDFFGVMMPVRSDSSESAMPAWATLNIAPPAGVAAVA